MGTEPERSRFRASIKEVHMTRIVLRAALILAAVALAGAAEAKGCLKGAAVGGLAGHAVGHGIAGAAAGCAIGRHEANKQDKTKVQNGGDQPATR
jgi:hypothetical protein